MERSSTRDEEPPSVRLRIIEQATGGSATFFEPQRELNESEKNAYHCEDDKCVRECRSVVAGLDVEGPEKKLTLFALQLAVLEKAASGLGTLGFIWATVVLLGGFAIALQGKDFWCITIILLIEGARIFSRSHELEWQHQATWSLADAGRSSFRALKSSSRVLLRSLKLILRPFSVLTTTIPSDVEMFRDKMTMSSQSNSQVPSQSAADWLFLSKNVSRVLYWLQLLSAASCVSLALMRLMQQDFGELLPDDPDKKNRKPALNIFYGLALAEALLFLAERAYWEWTVSHHRLLEEVNRECHLGVAGLVFIKRFFYDAYSECVEGSIFDGLKMDLVTFAAELLASTSLHEQLIGARILLKFSTNHRFAHSTLRKIGNSTPTIKRLIEMLSWKDPAEEEIRRSAALIVSKLAGKEQNALRLAGIQGAMESISSLLYTEQSSPDSRPDEVGHLCTSGDQEDHSMLNLLGLLILKKLANNHDNCEKIGNARGLLTKIIEFTGGGEKLRKLESEKETGVTAVKRSLQVVKVLASTTGQTGKVLRQGISEIVFTISNIREIIQHGERHMPLQKLGIEALTCLAMDEDARERIGATGEMIKDLLCIFFKEGFRSQQNGLRVEAGEALAMLAWESKSNCCRILRESGSVGRLVKALGDPVLRVHSVRILHNLCAYASEDHFPHLRGVTAGTGMVLAAIMTAETKLLEVSLGLTTQLFKFMNAEEFAHQLHKSSIREDDLVERLVNTLHKYDYPCPKLPRIRRFAVEVSIWMMRCGEKHIKFFRDLGMEKELRSVLETTSELECFNVFSGSVGVGRRTTALCYLVDAALELIGADLP